MKQFFKVTALVLCVMLVAACEKQTSSKTAFSQYCNQVNFKKQASQYLLNIDANNKHSELFFIHNDSAQKVLLNKNNRHQGAANAGWSSIVDPGNWSALLLKGNNDFELSCQKVQAGKAAMLDCSQVIQVCHAKQVRYRSNMTGAFWLTENQPTKTFLSAIKKRGVIVK